MVRSSVRAPAAVQDLADQLAAVCAFHGSTPSVAFDQATLLWRSPSAPASAQIIRVPGYHVLRQLAGPRHDDPPMTSQSVPIVVPDGGMRGRTSDRVKFAPAVPRFFPRLPDVLFGIPVNRLAALSANAHRRIFISWNMHARLLLLLSFPKLLPQQLGPARVVFGRAGLRRPCHTRLLLFVCHALLRFLAAGFSGFAGLRGVIAISNVGLLKIPQP
jgi:hypothetical protein